MLFDWHGRLLVENRHAFNISLVREQARDIPGTLKTLAPIAGVPEEALGEIVRRHQHEPRYRPMLPAGRRDHGAGHRGLARRLEMPALIVEQVPTRRYPEEALAAHLFGYVGEVTDLQLARTEIRRARRATWSVRRASS